MALLPIGTRLIELSIIFNAHQDSFKGFLTCVTGRDDYPFVIQAYNRSKNRYKTPIDRKDTTVFGGDARGIQADRLNVIEVIDDQVAGFIPNRIQVALLTTYDQREEGIERLKKAAQLEAQKIQQRIEALSQSLATTANRVNRTKMGDFESIEQDNLQPIDNLQL